MRKGLITALVLTGFLLGTVTFATAGQVKWTLLDSASATGRGPGPDGVIGVNGCGDAEGDDTATGEWNNCNFDLTNDCKNTGTPTTGSFSYSATEYTQTKSCYGGDNVGQSCLDDGDCPGSQCQDCTNDPTEWDVVLYLGDIDHRNGDGTMTWCQETGSSGSTITSMKIGASSPDPLAGPICTALGNNGPYTTTACAVDQLFSYTVDSKTLIGCIIPFGTLAGIQSQARVIDINDSAPTPTCGYSAADILCLQAEAPPTATYLLITCSDTTLDTVAQWCLSGARAKSAAVYWTADFANDCDSACPTGGCLAGAAEGVD